MQLSASCYVEVNSRCVWEICHRPVCRFLIVMAPKGVFCFNAHLKITSLTVTLNIDQLVPVTRFPLVKGGALTVSGNYEGLNLTRTDRQIMDSRTKTTIVSVSSVIRLWRSKPLSVSVLCAFVCTECIITLISCVVQRS